MVCLIMICFKRNWSLAFAVITCASWRIFKIGQTLEICESAGAKFGYKQAGQLLGHVTEEHDHTRSVADCVALCGRHSQCFSVNYALEVGNCQINTHVIATAVAEDFAPNENMLYMENVRKYLKIIIIK